MGEIAPVILKDRYQPEMLSKSVSSIFGNSNAKPVINGMREMTRSLVNVLEQLTLRQDLRYLTLTYQGVIKDRDLFHQHSGNVSHAFRTGLHQTKLSEKMVLKIHQYRKQGKFLREVGKLLNVSHSTIWEIEQGFIYKRVA